MAAKGFRQIIWFVLASAALHVLAFWAATVLYTRKQQEIKPSSYQIEIISPEQLQAPEAITKFAPKAAPATKSMQDQPAQPKPPIDEPQIVAPVAPVEPESQAETETPVSKDEGEASPEPTIETPPPILSPVPAYPPVVSGKRLFDKDVLGKFQKEGRQKESSVSAKDGITFDTAGFKYSNYMQRLKQSIEGVWKYPEEAAKKGIYGDLKIRFVIKKDGSLGEVKVMRTSGYVLLDRAASEAIKRAEPFWPLPEDWGTDNLTITGHFFYTIYGTYVR